MKLDYKKEIDTLCSLLRIEPQERTKYVEYLKRMLDWFKVLDELDLEDYKPFIHLGFHKLSLREDKILEFKEQNKIIENFPEKIDRFLKAFSPIKEFKKR